MEEPKPFAVYLPAALKAPLDAEAEREKRSRNAQAAHMIEARLLDLKEKRTNPEDAP